MNLKEHNENRTLGGLIRKVRRQRKVKQTDLARILGVSPSYISFIEKGSRKGTGLPPVISDKLLAQVQDWLAEGDELANLTPDDVAPQPEPVADEGTYPHAMYNALKYFVELGQHVYLWGPAGSGKSTAAEQIADELDMSYAYVSLNPQTSEFRLLGYKDASGNYQRTPFRECYENGGVFCIDELDNANPALLTTLNGALAGESADFPDGNVKRHADFVCVSTGNTNGRGANKQFSDRRKMDAATMDRFMFLEWDIDTVLEARIARNINPEKGAFIASWIQRVRTWAATHAPMLQVSPRCTFRMATTIDKAPLARTQWLDATVFHGLDKETVQTCMRANPFGGAF